MTIKELLLTRKRMWQLEPIDQIKRLMLMLGVYAVMLGALYGLLFPLLDNYHFAQQKAVAYEKIMSAQARVDLGVMDSNYVGGRYIARDDKVAKSLRAFLEEMVPQYPTFKGYAFPPPNNCVERFYVTAVNGDETQVVIKNSCGSRAYVPIFATREGSDWQIVEHSRSDKLGIPECEYVNDNHIDKAVAPVCGSELNELNKQFGSYVVR